MEINSTQLQQIFKVISFVYPKYSENIQEWAKDRVVATGFIYVVRRNNKIIQAFFEMEDVWMTDAMIKRLFSKVKNVENLEFHLQIVDHRWRIGWKVK
ncbi:hypothetical protein [Faecalibacter sp. LW9]|uniref:hypothetical protein n=1 Tax=Faecalibacter sp. LW9 TaxID=3103144 RepID=UPI002AFDE99A|nr:hypothetical protein [Faecalibacter sp. LW9]